MTDALDSMRTLLSGNWKPVNTNGRTPKFMVMVDESDANFTRRIDASAQDWCVIYSVAHTEDANAIGKTTKRTEDRVSIDLRTGLSRAQAKLLRDEVSRILDANITVPGAGYNWLAPAMNWQDLSNKMTRLWRYVFDVRITAINVTRGV